MKTATKKRITKKMIAAFLDEVAYVKRSETPGIDDDCYYSKVDDSYITHVGLETDLPKVLLRKGITEQIQCANPGGRVVSIGYNPTEKKWYGWSHRAMFGFTIGSECLKGHVHYNAYDEDDFMHDCLRFWKDPEYHKMTAGEIVEQDGKRGALISWKYNDNVPNEALRGTTDSMFCEFPEKFGKGEWVAKTMEDAKQMAIDFANNIA